MNIHKNTGLPIHILIISTLAFIGIILALIPVHKVDAATKSIQLDTTIADDDPYISPGGYKATDTGVDLSEPINNTTTRSDSSENETGGPWGYTWHVNMPTLCTGAELLSLRVVTNTETENETSLSGIFLAVYSGSDTLVFRDNYTINDGKGEDLDTWLPFESATPAVDRGIGSDGLFPAGLGLEGQLDATWDLSTYDSSETLGIYIQHWIDDGSTTIAQTALQSIELLYDDSACSSEPLTTPVANNTTSYLVLPDGITNPVFTTTPDNQITTDPAFSYPAGLVSFQFDTDPGATETVTLYFDLPGSPSSYVARKYNPTTKAFTTIDQATITRETYNNQDLIKLTYPITDGGLLDQDNQVNGTIVDPVGLATQNTNAPDTGLPTHWLLGVKG